MKGVAFLEIAAYAFGLVLVLVGLVWAFIAFNTSFHSACWGNAQKEVISIQNQMLDSAIRVGQSDYALVTLGSCVDGLFLLNQDDFFNFFRKAGLDVEGKFECAKDYKSMIAISPRSGEKAGLFLGIKQAFVNKEGFGNLTQWAKEHTGFDVKPFCKNIPCENCTFTEAISLEAPNEKEKSYCLKIDRESKEDYLVSVLGEVQTKQDCERLFNIETGLV